MRIHVFSRPYATVGAAMALLTVSLIPAQPSARRNTISAVRTELGDHPAAPTPFEMVSHVHHPPNSLVGETTPDLIPTEIASGLLMRMLGTLKARDMGQPGGARPALGKFIHRIEKATNHQFNDFDRASIELFASVDLKGSRPKRRAEAWDELKHRVSPSARRALERFLQENVKRQTKVLR